MRRTMLVLSVVALFMSLPALGSPAEKVKAYGPPITIDGKTLIFVEHGWAAAKDDFPSADSFKTSLQASNVFYLLVDGADIPVTYFHVEYNPITDSWLGLWRYDFQPMSFSAGVHTFQGVWGWVENGEWHYWCAPPRSVTVEYCRPIPVQRPTVKPF